MNKVSLVLFTAGLFSLFALACSGHSKSATAQDSSADSATAFAITTHNATKTSEAHHLGVPRYRLLQRNLNYFFLS